MSEKYIYISVSFVFWVGEKLGGEEFTGRELFTCGREPSNPQIVMNCHKQCHRIQLFKLNFWDRLTSF